MAIVIKRKPAIRKPDPIVPTNDWSLLSDHEQISFVRTLAQQHARRDHALALSRKGN